jgi:hypothetical protein
MTGDPKKRSEHEREPDVDGIRALRAALKVLLRRFGLRCVSIKQQPRFVGPCIALIVVY